MLPKQVIDSPIKISGKFLREWAVLFFEYMQSINDDFDPGHRIEHIERVFLTAVNLAVKHNACLSTIVPAAILHDTTPVNKFSKERAMASTFSADNTEKLLVSWGYSPELIPAIKHAVLTHSFSAGIPPKTLEAKIIQDADRLDALGAIGIYRTIAVGVDFGNPLYNRAEPFPVSRSADDSKNTLDHFYVKLFTLRETLHTVAAKIEADRRIQIMEIYLKALASEIGVDYISYQEYQKSSSSFHIEHFDAPLKSD